MMFNELKVNFLSEIPRFNYHLNIMQVAKINLLTAALSKVIVILLSLGIIHPPVSRLIYTLFSLNPQITHLRSSPKY